MTRLAHASWKVPVPPRRRVVTLAALLGALLLAVPVTARAQSKSDAFAGKIPPVSAALYRKAARFEATLSGNLSLNDPFYTKYFGGLKLGYHFTETLSAAVTVGPILCRAFGPLCSQQVRLNLHR